MLGNSLVDKLLGNEKISTNYTAQIDEAFKRIKKGDSFAKAMDSLEIPYSLTQSLNDYVNSTDRAKLSAEEFAASNASAMKSVSKTSSSVSVASKAITGLSTVLKTTVGVLANMAIGFAIGAAITGVIKLFDELYVSAEEANEAMDISFSGYEDAKAQVESINSELDSTNARISELQSKGSLTFVEKSELANLKEARKELELQQDLAEKAETKAAKDAGNKALQAYEKSFGDFEVSQDKINEYLRDTDITRNNASLFADENNISALIAGIQQMKELQREAKSEGDLEEVERYQGIIDDTTDSIWNQVTSLENYKSKLSEIPETLRTKEQAGALKEISDTIDFVYKKLDPNKWKELKFDEILSSDDSFDGIVDELEKQSKAAGDAGITVDDLKNKYPELASAITGAGMTLSDFVEEINAQAQGIETATTDIEALESSFRTFQVSAVDAINQVDTLNAALVNSFSGKGLEIGYEESEDGVVSLTGDIVNLQSAYADLEGYNPELLFERTANGVQVNREALRALQAQQEANQKSIFAQKELELQDQLTLAYQRLKEAQASGDSVAAADQQNVISTLQSQIENVQLLSSAYDGATSAYQKWLSAQSNGEAGDMYRTVSETMKERGEELYKEGRYNTEEFRAIADYYSNQDLSTASMEEVVAAYQNAATARDRYFTGTKEGIDNFIYDAQQKVPEMFETITDETGKEKIKFNIDDEDLANKMNLSVEAIQNILDAATEYEDDFIIGDSSSAEELAQKLAEAIQKADEAKTKLKELQDQGKISTDIEFDVDVSKLDEAGIDERITELTDLKNHLIEINADASQIEYVDQLLNEANARKDQLAQQTNVDVSVNINNEEDLAALGEKLSTLPKDETSNVSINIQNESQLDGVVQQIEQVPKDTSVNLSLTVQNQEQADALESKLENLKSEGHSIDYKVNIVPGDTGALDTTLQDGSVNVTATVTGNDQVSELKKNIDGLSDKTVKVTVSADGAGNINSIKENLSSIPLLKSTSVTASVTGKESVQALTEAISKVLGKSVNVNAKVSGTDDVNELVAAIAKVVDKYVTVSASTSGTSSVNALASAIAGVNSKTVTVTTNNVTNNITNNSVRQLASGTLLSPALVSGTAYNVINTTPAYANGNVSLSRDETALINELGTESIIRNGRWFLVPGGMHLENVKKGDIILSAKQTQDLLKSGKASGRGKAYADGTLGNVRNLVATSLLDAYSSGSWVFGNTGSGNLKGTGATYKPSSNNSSTNKATQSVNKAASNLSSAAKSTSSAAKETSEAAEKLSDTLSGYTDWIERVFEARERELEHLESQLDNIAHLPDRQAKSYEILAKNREYINNTQSAKQTYQSHLDMLESQMGLDPTILNQIRSGSFDISKYDDETQKLISEYQEYYDKLQDCSAQYDQLIAQQEEYAQTVLDNISDYYDMMNGVDESAMGWLEGQRELWENQGKNNDFGNQYSSIRNSMAQQQKVSDRLQKQVDDFAAEIERLISEGYMQRYSQQYFEAHETLNGFKQELYESQSALIEFEDQLRELDYTAIQNKIDGFAQAVDKISAQINLMEARDQKVPESAYQQQIDANNNQIAANQQLRASKLKEQGLYDVGSTRYQELAEEINDLDVETLNLMADNEALKDSIYELRFANLDNQIEAYGKLKDEIEDFRSLLNEDAFFAKNGGLTEEGLAELALLQQGIATSKNEIADYREGLEKLKKSYANGVISLDEYNEKSEEYCAGIRDSIKDVSDYEDALTDLYMTQMRTENEALQEIIDKRKEALQAKESYYDYDKTLKNQQKDVSMLQAQIQALEGVNNATAQAEVKRLRAELETAQDTLNETKRDHAIDMQEQGYDSMSDQLNQILEDTEYEITHNADKQQEVIQSMLSNVVNMYASAYGQINSIIANTGWVGSSDFNQNQQQLSSSNGAKTQTNNALKNQSSVKPSGSATSTATSPISNNSSYNSKVESEIMKAPNTTNRLVAELKLSPTSVSLEEGKSTKITASMRPNDAKNKTLSWKSSNQSVATVSGGTINAVAPGSCQITVSTTDGSGLSASVGVTVTEKPKPVQQEPTPSTSAPVSNGGDGVPKVGDKATFTGSYYYSSWGTSPSGSLYSGVENGVVINSYSNKKYGGTARITGDYDVSISSADGKYQLGWVKLSQLSGYSAGTKGVTNNAEIARIDELGKELRIKRGGDIYEMFHYGDAVLPKPMTDNLFTLADHTNEIMETINGVDRSGNGDVTVNNNYESLLTVNGDIDKDTFPGVKKMCEEAYQYTSKKMKKDARYMGITRTL